MLEILMVCTGNICRSPMAMALMRHALEARRCTDVEVTSAGTAALADGPASGRAVEALRAVGVDLTPHRSRPVTASELRRANLIVAMTSEHVHEVTEEAPEVAGKVVLLKALAEMDVQPQSPDASRHDRLEALLSAARPEARPALDVADPYGASARAYTATAGEIAQAVDVLVAALCGTG
jgi:protein-tyrosine-phosphatase